MSISVEELLVGPRGRRLLLEFALQPGEDARDESAEFRATVSRATRRLDPNPGVLLGPGACRAEQRECSPADVAALLETLPLASPDGETLLRALAQTVDVARYWQEPDGADVLAATPSVGDDLGRIAAHIAEAPATNWWSEPIAGDNQRAVHWADEQTRSDVDSHPAPAQRLALWRSETVEEEERAQRDRPSDPNAPHSGVWWSTPPRQLTQTTRNLGSFGPAGLWLVEDRFNEERASVQHVSVSEQARVYEIDSTDAWAELCRRDSIEVTAAKRHDWYRTTGRVGRWIIPDWSRIATDYDAVHLTVAGYLAAGGTAIPVDDDTASVIAGWNPDETYWLTETASTQPGGQTWVLESETWRRAAGPL